MDRLLGRFPAYVWCLWVAGGLTVVGGLTALAGAAGGQDRVAGVALLYAFGVAATAANALTQKRSLWLTAFLYVAGLWPSATECSWPFCFR